MGDRGGTDEQAGAGPEAAGAAREPAAGAGVEAAGAMPAAAPGAPAAGSPAWLDEEEMPAWLAFLEVSHLLERAGLVRRGKCPSDERGVLAAVTSAGRAALGRAAPGHVRVVRHFLIDALTAAQRSALRDGLAAARERLRAP